MEFAQLELFVAVAEHGGITAAAERLLRAPSNVSTRIRQLEKELGVNLLLRDKRQVSLSAEGEAFLVYARQLIDMAGGMSRGKQLKFDGYGQETYVNEYGDFSISGVETKESTPAGAKPRQFHLYANCY